jgi:hypothetical protein
MVGLIVQIVVALIGLFCIIAAVVSGLRAWRSRYTSSRKMYAVGRQEALQGAKVGFLRAVVLLVVGVILLAISGLTLAFGDGEAVTSTATATARSTTLATLTRPASPTPLFSPTPTTDPTIAAATALAPPPGTPVVSTPPSAATAGSTTTPPASPTITPTSPPSAVVNSPVGLYLREAPGGIQEVELLGDGTVLILLPGRTTIDGQEWQEVRTPSGLEGWVAVEFIIYQ